MSSVLPAHADDSLGFEDVAVVDGGSTWVIGGWDGIVLVRDGSTWSAPKTYTSEPIVAVPFLSGSQGFALGTQFLVCEWR